MKKYFLLLSLFFAANAYADVQSEALLAKIRAKVAATDAYKVDFRSSDFTGVMIVSGSRYQLRSSDLEVYYDGSTLWSYNVPAREVNVESLPVLQTNMLTNPSKLMAVSSADFEHKMLNGNTIELKPRDQKIPYSRVEIMVNLLTLVPQQATITDRQSGKQTVIYVANFTPGVVTDASTFRFDAQKHKGVDVVDFR